LTQQSIGWGGGNKAQACRRSARLQPFNILFLASPLLCWKRFEQEPRFRMYTNAQYLTVSRPDLGVSRDCFRKHKDSRVVYHRCYSKCYWFSSVHHHSPSGVKHARTVFEIQSLPGGEGKDCQGCGRRGGVRYRIRDVICSLWHAHQ